MTNDIQKADVQKAFDELRNAIWLLVVPLVVGIFSLAGYCQWTFKDQQLMEQIEDFGLSTTGVIQEVEASECSQPRPRGAGHLCAQSIGWWSPTGDTGCEGGQCYVPAWVVEWEGWLVELEDSYIPILIPGLIPLLLLFMVIRKIKKARRAMESVLETKPPT